MDSMKIEFAVESKHDGFGFPKLWLEEIPVLDFQQSDISEKVESVELLM